jgi:hypothetical protein
MQAVLDIADGRKALEVLPEDGWDVSQLPPELRPGLDRDPDEVNLKRYRWVRDALRSGLDVPPEVVSFLGQMFARSFRAADWNFDRKFSSFTGLNFGAKLVSEWGGLEHVRKFFSWFSKRCFERHGTGGRSPIFQSFREIVRDTFMYQLTEGCSIGCNFCGAGAMRGVKRAFSYEELEFLAHLSAGSFAKNRSLLYYASDPFDWTGKLRWDSRGLGYPAAHFLFAMASGYKPGVSTAIPAGQEEFVHINGDIVDRISVSYVNRSRLQRHFGPDLERLRDLASRYAIHLYNVLVDPELNLSTKAKEKYRTDEYRTNTALFTKYQRGPGCFNGVYLTPLKATNVVQFHRTERYHEAQATVDIDPTALWKSLPRTADQIAQVTRDLAERTNRDGLPFGPIEAVLSRGVVSLVRHSDTSQYPPYIRNARANLGRNGTVVRVRNHMGSEFYVILPEEGLYGEVFPISLDQYSSLTRCKDVEDTFDSL